MNESTMSPTSSLIRLNQEGKTESVTRRLIEMIDLGLFTEGEQLPNESALATQLGVATVTLRDALAGLRERGVIETRRGRSGGASSAPHRKPQIRPCSINCVNSARLNCVTSPMSTLPFQAPPPDWRPSAPGLSNMQS